MEIVNKTYNYHSHKSHNPSCDILERRLNYDTFITYGIYVKPTIHWKGPVGLPITVGTEFMEIYTGENYNAYSKKRSYSKLYYADEIPSKYKEGWLLGKWHYENNLKNL